MISNGSVFGLDSSDLEGVTDAMIEHALAHEIKNQSNLATEGYLLEGLNKRLDTHFHEMAHLKAYIKKEKRTDEKEQPQ